MSEPSDDDLSNSDDNKEAPLLKYDELYMDARQR